LCKQIGVDVVVVLIWLQLPTIGSGVRWPTMCCCSEDEQTSFLVEKVSDVLDVERPIRCVFRNLEVQAHIEWLCVAVVENIANPIMRNFYGGGAGGDGGDDMGDGDGFGPDEGGDAIEMDDTQEMMPEMGNYGMMENVSLKAAPKPVTSEEGGVNKKSTVAANAGAKGPVGSTVKPVSTTGAEAHGRPAPTAKDLIGRVGNTPAQGTQKPSAATKPKTGQEGGVNNKSIVPGKHN
jgi:hypothetical protein